MRFTAGRRAQPSILMISVDEFSGVRPRLMAALERHGCRVIHRRQSLRFLGPWRYWYALLMILSAVILYRGSARALLHRTAAAFAAKSKACEKIIAQHPGMDVILLVGSINSAAYRRKPPNGPSVILYTDYLNLISQQLPEAGYPLIERRVYERWHRLEQLLLGQLDHIFVMGAHVKPAIECAYRIAPSRVSAIGAGPGLDVDIERDGRQKDYTRPMLLFVGKLPDVKGLSVLLRAFARVREHHPTAELHAVTPNHPGAPGVTIHRNLRGEQLRELFYTAPIFVMPAYKEPLGLVFLEAMWSKCVCLGTSTGSMPEIIADGETGVIVPVGDDITLTRRLLELLEDPARLKVMAERGYAQARLHWGWDLVADRMLQTISSVQAQPYAR